jgi:hypothetical protein
LSDWVWSANGVIMLAAPAAVPGVPATGPFNAHFVRDIGVAYLVAGMALAAFACDRAARPAALAGAALLALHAHVHLGEATAGREAAPLFDVLLVFVPAVLAIWIAWPHALDMSKQTR